MADTKILFLSTLDTEIQKKTARHGASTDSCTDWCVFLAIPQSSIVVGSYVKVLRTLGGGGWRGYKIEGSFDFGFATFLTRHMHMTPFC